MKKIVFTGGPQGGKTTVINALKEEYGDDICVVNEAATHILKDLFPQPGRDLQWSEKWSTHFQKAIMPLQEQNEDAWSIVAGERGTKALIMDRGILDGAAYIPGGIENFLKTFKIDLPDIYSRYDAVIHMETVAKTRPEIFGSQTNSSRYESGPEIAISLDDSLTNAWKDHPNWHLVPSHLGKKGIVHRALEIVSELIDWEIEKKYLLPKMPEIKLGQGTPIQQGYFFNNNDFRLRQYGEQYFLTFKGEGNEERKEWEKPIPKYLFDELWSKTKERRINKTRYLIPSGKYMIELDQYHDRLEGLITFECEFRSKDEITTFKLPTWAKSAVDITNDKVYKNHNLAKDGLPRDCLKGCLLAIEDLTN